MTAATASVQETSIEGELPAALTAGAVLVRALADSGLLAEVGQRVWVHRRPGYSFPDAFLFLVYFFAAGGHLGGLRGFYEDHREWRCVLGALGGRARLPSSAALSRLLSVADGEALSEALRWLLLHASGGLELLRSEAVMTRDARGQKWQVFDFDPSRTAYRRRALPESDDLPPATRRLAGLAAPGWTGRKRGEQVSSDGLLQHAGSGLWLDVTVCPGNGDPRMQFASAVSAVSATADALSHPRSRALMRADGEFGGVPSLTEAQAAGIAYLTRMVRYEVLALPAVRERLARARWERVEDSGSGPVRYAAELGDVLLPGGTLRADGTPYDPVTVRVVVSRCAGAESGAGVQAGDEIIETFAAIGLTREDWPAASLVEGYYARIGQENSFSQFDGEIGSDTTWSTRPGGQRLALACAMFVWNARIVRGTQSTPPLPAPLPQTPWTPAAHPGPEPIRWSKPPAAATPELQIPTEVEVPTESKVAADTGASPELQIPTVAPGEPEVAADTGAPPGTAPLQRPESDPLRAALLLAGVEQVIARRKGWAWEPDTATVIAPDGERLPLRIVERHRLRFHDDRRKRQSVVDISPEVALQVRAAWHHKEAAAARVRAHVVRPQLTRPADDPSEAGLAVGWPDFQPARARARELRAHQHVAICVRLVIVSRATAEGHPLVSGVPRHERHRRLTKKQRLARNAIGRDDRLSVSLQARPTGPAVAIRTWSSGSTL